MAELTNFCFNGGDKEFILIITYGAIWTNSQEKYRLSFNKSSLKLVINSLPDNYFITFCSMCFCQPIEFPTDSYPTPLWKIYFSTIMKRSYFFRQKERHTKGSYIFNVLGL